MAEAERVDDETFDSSARAAIAAALEHDPGLVDPVVTNSVTIFTDPTTTDLRVQVRADGGYCQWFGVNGRPADGMVGWRADPALACDE